MNSFDSNDDLSLLKALNPAAGRPEPTDDLILSAIQRPQGKVKRFNFGNRPQLTWGLAGTALAACVTLALVPVFYIWKRGLKGHGRERPIGCNGCW
jgi:hypothetical protein